MLDCSPPQTPVGQGAGWGRRHRMADTARVRHASTNAATAVGSVVASTTSASSTVASGVTGAVPAG